MYRYRENSGVTEESLNRAKRHLHKLGKLLEVKGYVYRGRYGATHTGVLVRGEKGTARFSGFAWGYGGEGPRGLYRLLTELGVEDAQAKATAFVNYRWTHAVGEVWKIDLSN